MKQYFVTKRSFLVFVFVVQIISVSGQNCQVKFPGTATRDFSTSCGSSADNLVLGDNVHMGDGDTFTFDISANIDGNVSVKARGSGKIIIPTGVTVTVDGNFQLDPENSGCTSSNPCIFEIEVNGTLIISQNLQNNLFTVVWSGTGTVVVEDDLQNSSNGCMACDTGGCPNFTGDPDCSDDGNNCSNGDFCAAIADPCSSDTSKPTITGCPPNIITNITGPGCTRAVSWEPPQADDNCALATFTPNYQPGAPFPKGVHTVTYTALDASGNAQTCSFTVTVNDPVKPVFTSCPPTVVITSYDPILQTGSATWDIPQATDNCTTVSLVSSAQPGDNFAKGITMVTYTATDASGNITKCDFVVNMTDCSSDTSKPVITCPANIVTNITGSGCTRAVTWEPPVATDNCSTMVPLVSSADPGDIFEKGITIVTYTATDVSGNSITCSFTVTVNDPVEPIFTSCQPTVVITSYDPILQTGTATWDIPQATDNCTTVSLVSSAQPGDNFAKGITMVTYTATDASGNITKCEFEVNMTEGKTEIQLEVYKALSPNNDGLNDVWHIKGIDKYPDNKVTVFDRWGREVYTGKGYNNETVVWDGLTGGKAVPAGTYFYTIEINNEGSILRGPLELVN